PETTTCLIEPSFQVLFTTICAVPWSTASVVAPVKAAFAKAYPIVYGMAAPLTAEVIWNDAVSGGAGGAICTPNRLEVAWAIRVSRRRPSFAHRLPKRLRRPRRTRAAYRRRRT